MRDRFFMFLLFFFPLSAVFGQANLSVDESGWKLPPLQTLIDSAMLHSNAVKLADYNITMSEYELKKLQRDWLDRFQLNGNVRYGSEIYFNNSGVLIDNIYERNDNNAFYNAGVYFTVPLSHIFDRKLPRQKAKISIEQSRLQKEEIKRGVREMVISVYYDFLTLQNAFNMQNELLSTANLTFDQAELDYASNKISFTEYTQIQTSLLSAQHSYEQIKNTYTKALLLMEELVGIKLIKK